MSLSLDDILKNSTELNGALARHIFSEDPIAPDSIIQAVRVLWNVAQEQQLQIQEQQKRIVELESRTQIIIKR